MRNNNTAFRTTGDDKRSDWFSVRLLQWYDLNKRHLPWRETKDPFKIWLSEIILQQTRVNQGLPYYEAFTQTFENVNQFARADLDDILKLWQGLGYYSRARNMHHCANTVVEDYDGHFPSTYKGLLQLKGIGKYTAAAIASICFNEPVPVVDGNVYRVISRIFGLSDDIAKASTFSVFFDQASELISQTVPGDFNQAMMEFGATVCTPKSPECSDCIFSSDCYAMEKGVVADLPIKSNQIKIRNRHFNYIVYIYRNYILIRKRGLRDIWRELYEFDLIETEKSAKIDNFGCGKHLYSSEEIAHQLTHQKLHIRFHVYELKSRESLDQLACDKKMQAVDVKDLVDYAVPKPIELFLKEMFCK